MSLVPAESGELHAREAELRQFELRLADQEASLARDTVELEVFHDRYRSTVGVLLAELDELEAEITETIAARYPHDDTARTSAGYARAHAAESRRTAEAQTDAHSPDDELTKLYRDVARRIHPDLAADSSQTGLRTSLMAEANAAYARGDRDRLLSLLDEWDDRPESVVGVSSMAQIERIMRRIKGIHARLAEIEHSRRTMQASELWALKEQAARASATGQDLLMLMASEMQRRVAAARARLDSLTT